MDYLAKIKKDTETKNQEESDKAKLRTIYESIIVNHSIHNTRFLNDLDNFIKNYK